MITLTGDNIKRLSLYVINHKPNICTGFPRYSRLEFWTENLEFADKKPIFWQQNCYFGSFFLYEYASLQITSPRITMVTCTMCSMNLEKVNLIIKFCHFFATDPVATVAILCMCRKQLSKSAISGNALITHRKRNFAPANECLSQDIMHEP